MAECSNLQLTTIRENQPKLELVPEMTRKVVQLNASWSEYVKIRNIHLERQNILIRILKEKESALEKFLKIESIVGESIQFYEGSAAFKKICRERKHLLSHVELSYKKLDQSGKILEEAGRKNKLHLAKIQSAYAVLDKAGVDLPNLDRSLSYLCTVEPYPDADFKQLESDWDKMQLNARASRILRKIEKLSLKRAV